MAAESANFLKPEHEACGADTAARQRRLWAVEISIGDSELTHMVSHRKRLHAFCHLPGTSYFAWIKATQWNEACGGDHLHLCRSPRVPQDRGPRHRRAVAGDLRGAFSSDLVVIVPS